MTSQPLSASLSNDALMHLQLPVKEWRSASGALRGLLVAAPPSLFLWAVVVATALRTF